MENDFKNQIKVILPSEKEKENIFNEYLNEQQEQFIRIINYINEYMNTLREKGIISSFLEMRARIKSKESAFNNDGVKALNDVFGMELICASEEEINIAIESLSKLFIVVKRKVHNNKNGYKALHYTCSAKEDLIELLWQMQFEKDYIPLIEFQYKTIAVDYRSTYGKKNHEEYKHTDIEQVQRLYDEGKLIQGKNIPYMWISDSNNKKMRKLTVEETIKKMYPSIKMKEKYKEQGKK